MVMYASACGGVPEDSRFKSHLGYIAQLFFWLTAFFALPSLE